MSISNELSVTLLATMEYRPCANKQLERFNDAVFSVLRHYAANRQQYWKSYVVPFTYAYNAQNI